MNLMQEEDMKGSIDCDFHQKAIDIFFDIMSRGYEGNFLILESDLKDIMNVDTSLPLNMQDILFNFLKEYMCSYSAMSVLKIKFKIYELFEIFNIKPDLNRLIASEKFDIIDNKFSASFVYFLTENSNLNLLQEIVKRVACCMIYFNCKELLGAIHHLGVLARNEEMINKALQGSIPQNYSYFISRDAESFKQVAVKDDLFPKVSILCSTYNHEMFIDRTMAGFFEQEKDFSFEIIVSDDASTDATFDKLSIWKKKFPDIIKIIKFHKNIYQSSGRRPTEVLISEAKGKYIAICEGDDFWVNPRKLQCQVDILDKYPSLMSTTHNFFKFDTSKMELKEHYKLGKPKVDTEREILRMQRLFWVHTLMFRNKFSEIPKEWFASPAGDQILTSFLGNFGANLHVTDFFGSVQRRNPYSVWMPLDEYAKNCARLKSRYAILFMNQRLRNSQAIDDCIHICKLFEEQLPKDKVIEIKERCIEDLKLAAYFRLSDLEFEII